MGPEVRMDSAQLEKYRSYLRLVARLDFDPCLQGMLDLTGVIQQTLLAASLDASLLERAERTDVLTWLHQVLALKLMEEVQRLRLKMDGTGAEGPLDEVSGRIRARLAMDQSSPRTVASRQEELLRLSAAIERLPPDQQTAVILHHLQEMRLAEVAAHMNRSKPAVAGLLHRGMTRLRDLLQEPETSTLALLEPETGKQSKEITEMDGRV